VLYEKSGKDGDMQLGQVQVFDLAGWSAPALDNIFLPRDTGGNSRLADVETASLILAARCAAPAFIPLANSPLGCRKWRFGLEEVRPRIEQAFAALPRC